ncbi:MAG: hypothetical protein ACP5I8_00890 [Phycisphaerae bacterium]
MNGKKLLLIGLLVLNIVLAGGLLARRGWQTAAARAQVARGGHYLTVAGGDTAGGIVYVYNVDSGILTAKITPANNIPGTHWLAPYNVSADIKRARMQMR